MSTECYPITVLPNVSQLYRDFLGMAESAPDALVRRCYGAEPFSSQWMHAADSAPKPASASALADVLTRQNTEFHAGPVVFENIARLRAGARAVVTGQQVILFGGPVLTLLKAATAIARAAEASRVSGVAHVPIFWMATEDHDLAEVDQVSLLSKQGVETLRAGLHSARSVPVGGIVPGPELTGVLDRAAELLEFAPVSEWLSECYRPADGAAPTLALAFGRLMARIFADQGLVVMDASSREVHALGAATLRFAIEHAGALHDALTERSAELLRGGYHAQVLVAENASLLFLLDETTGERSALRRTSDGQWKAAGRVYSSADLLAILDAAPERLSPNALLRPVFQDSVLPTAAYIGGPAEIAYFAQSAVLYQSILGRVTPVLPRLSATLLEPAVAAAMEKEELQLPDAMTTPEALAQRMGARAMPIELKRRLASAGNAMDRELEALTDYLGAVDESLARSARVSASKMLYQMNRLRRLAATSELQKNASLRRHADAITRNVFPEGHPQERFVAGIWYVARYGETLIERLVQVAANQCPGHVIIRL